MPIMTQETANVLNKMLSDYYHGNLSAVVRCKDCKHRMASTIPNFILCASYSEEHPLNWFCADGEIETPGDVVRVVRCKDCKHRPFVDANGNPVFTDDICPCRCDEDPYYGWNPPDDWFCPNGEAKK